MSAIPATIALTVVPSQRGKSLRQQEYYKSLIPNLPEPYRNYAWTFCGLNDWTRKIVKEAEIEWVWDGYKVDFRPDAWFADEQHGQLYLLEIVETNDISDYKACSIDRFAWVVDEAAWNVLVVLFFPRQGRVAINPLCLEIGPWAEVKFKDQPSPHRKAFTLGIRELRADGSYEL